MTWLHWDLNDEQHEFLDFVRKAARVWREQPVLQRRKFFHGRAIRGSDIKDISWFEPSGEEVSDGAWGSGLVKCLGVRLAGDVIGEMDERGEPIRGDTLLLLLNAHHEPIAFKLPATKPEHHWERLLDTAAGEDLALVLQGDDEYRLEGRSLAVLRTRLPEETGQAISGTQMEQLLKETRSLPQASAAPAFTAS